MGKRQQNNDGLQLYWEEINFDTCYLHEIDAPFTEEEVREAIKQMPSDKAPGPDGSDGAFFKKIRDIIKEDIIRVIYLLVHLHIATIQWLNSANVVLWL